MERVKSNLIFVTLLLFSVFAVSLSSWANTETEIETRLNSSFELLLQQLPLLENVQEAKDVIRYHVMPLTDVRAVGQLMLGKHWKRATDVQRAQFVVTMTDKLINTYAAFLLDDRASKAKFEVVRVTKKEGSSSDRYNVVAVVTIDQPIQVDFLIYQQPGMDWKIVDVSVEGISVVLTWRTTLNELVDRNGLDQVISDLQSGKIQAKEQK